MENSQENFDFFSENSQFLDELKISYIKTPNALYKIKEAYGFTSAQADIAKHIFKTSHFKQDFQFSKSYSQIAKEYGASKRAVIDCVAKLIEIGLLKVGMQGNKQNLYKWNDGLLRFIGSANFSPREVKNIHLEGENFAPPEVKNFHHIYIRFLKEIFKISHKCFFEEEGGGYWRRVPPKKQKKGTKNDTADAAKLPKKVWETRSEAWDKAIEAVLKKKGSNVWVSTYIALKAIKSPHKTQFPKSYIRSIQSDAATQWQYKKSQGFPLHLESDEAFFEYIHTDPEFKEFTKKGES